ncbi:hypothetical protein L2E82_47061 [Cichorium intybus]|uniref:Uncharacterized protein n=1 Tax=Cichorium intybus TaxID=13427 RepID=A0ACB8YV23_CICIN|nr:hypothetical protein L2E82_47061 [Cichorium intybus]
MPEVTAKRETTVSRAPGGDPGRALRRSKLEGYLKAPWPFIPEAGPAFGDISVSPPAGLGKDWMIAWYAIVVQEMYGRSMDNAPCTPFVACMCQTFSQVVALGSKGKLLWRKQSREVVAGAVGRV